MWVLSTDRAELHFFPSPEDVPEDYAVLSHVWNKPGDGAPEQSFQDIRKIEESCVKDGTNPRDFVSEKIRRCCELAEMHGYKWVWIDTCCIDKTSSAELSEAINSMFRYYALAAICYGYLRDVDSVFFSQEDLEADRDLPDPYGHPRYSPFRRSIWFQRGWTLQELVAPRFFFFLSSSWEVIGTKADLAELLEQRCGIPAAVLRLQASHTQFSIAQRMSWFQRRQTTRREDEAYCLLGLFDIQMPPLYGEGRNAFRRLQEEIMKQWADTTLFAWEAATGCTDASSLNQCLFSASPRYFSGSTDFEGLVYAPPRRTQMPADVNYDDSALETRVRDVHNMTFAVTPTGIQAYIPIFTWRGEVLGDLFWSSKQGRSVFLHLEHDPDSQSSSSPYRSFRVGEPRLRIIIGSEYDGTSPPDPPSWQEVLIRHRPSLHRAPGQLPDFATSRFTPAIPMQLTFQAPVRFSEARIQKFLVESRSDYFEIRGAGLHSPWTADSDLPTAYVFKTYYHHFIIIKVGRCQKEGPPGTPRRPTAAIWATVRGGGARGQDAEAKFEEKISTVSTDPRHDCVKDHVLGWPDLRRRFQLEGRYEEAEETEEVVLSFARCPLNPGHTLIIRDASWAGWHGPLV
ncbi:heterokaryon incompatibility protein-domain-containing protein [Cerioporus squamosus]|nr:heterokaryon incompatibility protein-domain-containing protein [Cerioporus squamosus]